MAKKRVAKRKIRPSEISKLAEKLGLDLTSEQIKKIQEQDNPRLYMRKMRREVPAVDIVKEVRRLGLARNAEDIKKLVAQARRVTGLTAVEYVQRIAASRLASGNTQVNATTAKKIKLENPVDEVDLGYSDPKAPAYVTESKDGEPMLEVTVRIPLGDWQRDGYGVSLKDPPKVLRMDHRLNPTQRIAVGRIALGQYRIEGEMNGREITNKEQAVLRVVEMIGEAIAEKDAESRAFMEASI